MKNLKKFILFILIGIIAGCSNLDNSYQKIQNDFKEYKDTSKKYNIDTEWWKEYKIDELNNLIELALNNNKDLAKAAINVNKALYQANLIGADLVPSFSGSLESSASKNIKNGENSIISHSGTVSISYELDLWRKLSSAAKAEEWTYMSTIETMESTKLSLINNVIDTYFYLVYLNNVIDITKEKIDYYTEINTLVSNKFQYGNTDKLNVAEANQHLISAKDDLITYETEKNSKEQTLRNLLNLKPDEKLNINHRNILLFQNIGVDLDIPVSVIANRPDVKSYEYALNSAFKNAEASVKSLYPSVTLKSSLSSSDPKTRNAFNVPIGYGEISINLPFLNWNTVKWNVKIDEASYELAKLDFEKSITAALNEIDNFYYTYTQYQINYENTNVIFKYDNEISNYYKNRYENGVSELKDWLNALTTENDSHISLLNSKYNLIQSENKVYQSIAGKYSLR